MNSTRHCRWLLLTLALSVGCNRQDTEALTRIGKKLVARSEAVTCDLKHSAATSWQITQDSAVDSRVAARLRWDKQLADTPLEVQATGNTIELRGTVRDLEQHRRAVMLAESTVGVEGVKDSLVESDR
jgi:osmotically-inducible protein OsmY